MADTMEMQRPKSLVCPLCLDAFTNPKLLRCGHTFCKNCLVKYDGNDLGLAYVECPVCRKRTRLGQDRINGLSSNFSVKGLEDELQAKGDASTSHFCSLHSKIYKDILCKVCEEFICLTCYFDNHQGHKIKKKEEIEADLKKKRDAVIEKSQTKKSEVEKSITNVEQCRHDVYTHLDNLEREIRETYSKKVRTLQKNEEELLKDVNDIRKQSGKIFGNCISQKRQSIDNINGSLTALTSNTNSGKYLDSDTLKVHHMQYSDLENSLQDVYNEEYVAGVKRMAEDTQFLPTDENALDLGCIAPRVQSTVYTMCQLVQGCRYESSPTIVQKYDLSQFMYGMATLSQDTVVVGYGYSRYGSDCFSVSGEQKPHLKNNERVGNVCDIAFLTDGRFVMHQFQGCFVYNAQGRRKKDCEFTCRSNSRICSDQYDNFYAVSARPGIEIFHGRNPCADKIVPTGNVKPDRISVSKTGAIITSSGCTRDSLSTVNVYDSEGHAGSSITASDNGESLYAAVDSEDGVFVARVKAESKSFNLTRYTLQGTSLKESCVFKTLQLPDKLRPNWYNNSYRNCCMVSLTPNLIAFASGMHLYFMELTVK